MVNDIVVVTSSRVWRNVQQEGLASTVPKTLGIGRLHFGPKVVRSNPIRAFGTDRILQLLDINSFRS